METHMAKKNTKIYILDTNVILHDYMCIYQFQDNDIVLPITVLEELDKFKKGNENIHYYAREFTRELDSISTDAIFTNGIPLGKKRGKLFIETGKPFSKNLSDSFSEQTADHRILAITEHVSKNNADRRVVLVSKDINLRMKAKSLGLAAEDYESDKVQDVSLFNRNIVLMDKLDSNLVSGLYSEPDGLPASDFKFPQHPYPNQYYILKNGTTSALAYYNRGTDNICRVEKQKCYGIEPRNAEQAFSLDALVRKDVSLVALSGKAGTGKTLLALAAALAQENQFEQIILARPIVPLANRDIGFLPGDVDEKIGPY
jgi:PhoH-like ATPase